MIQYFLIPLILLAIGYLIQISPPFLKIKQKIKFELDVLNIEKNKTYKYQYLIEEIRNELLKFFKSAIENRNYQRDFRSIKVQEKKLQEIISDLEADLNLFESENENSIFKKEIDKLIRIRNENLNSAQSLYEFMKEMKIKIKFYVRLHHQNDSRKVDEKERIKNEMNIWIESQEQMIKTRD